VFAQVIAVTVVLAGVLVLVRRDRDFRLFVIGLLVFAYAFFGLRALH
jgi:hypothetical protein